MYGAASMDQAEEAVAYLCRHTDLPLCVGFGIRPCRRMYRRGTPEPSPFLCALFYGHTIPNQRSFIPRFTLVYSEINETMKLRT